MQAESYRTDNQTDPSGGLSESRIPSGARNGRHGASQKRVESNTFKPAGFLRLKTDTEFELFYKTRGEFQNLEFTLKRIQSAADEIGINDDIASKTVHIAGTNGKGSTAFFLEQILTHRGLSTASFTSPHITSVTERIRLNGNDISLPEFDKLFHELKPVITKHSLSYFEALTLIAFRYFKNSRPDAAIIETGLGGRLDSTNILEKKIPVITSISIDTLIIWETTF